MNIQINSTNIRYIDEGKGKTTLLFVHGWCINKTYWQAQVDFFKGNYRCVAIDIPGFGESTAQRSDWTIEAYSADLKGVIEELQLENVVLVAHSMAGTIALELLQKQHPQIIGMIGIDNFKTIGVTYSPEEYQQFDGMMKMLEGDFRNAAPAFAENMLLQPGTPKTVAERVKTDFAEADPQIGFATLSNLFRYSESEPSKLESLAYPLHLLNCDNMPTNIDGLAQHCKQGYSLTEVAATSHYPMIENADAFNVALLKIVKQIEE